QRRPGSRRYVTSPRPARPGGNAQWRDMPQATARAFLMVVCGLLWEARIASGARCRAMVGGGNGARLASEIERAIGDGGGGLWSFGMAGGLEPGLPPGTIIVASLVVSGGERFVTTHSWSARLRAMLPGSLERVIVGVDAPVASRKAKACLYASTGAA